MLEEKREKQPAATNATPANAGPSALNAFNAQTLLSVGQFLTRRGRKNLRETDKYLRQASAETDRYTRLMQYGPDFDALKKLELEGKLPEKLEDIPKLPVDASTEEVIAHLATYPHYHPSLLIQPLSVENLFALLRMTDDQILTASNLPESEIKKLGARSNNTSNRAAATSVSSANSLKEDDPNDARAVAAPLHDTSTNPKQQFATNIRRRAMMATLHFLISERPDDLVRFGEWLSQIFLVAKTAEKINISPPPLSEDEQKTYEKRLAVAENIKKVILTLDGANFVRLFTHMPYTKLSLDTRIALAKRAFALDKIDCSTLFSSRSLPKFMEDMPEEIQRDFARYIEEIDFTNFKKIGEKAAGLWNLIDKDILKASQKKISDLFAKKSPPQQFFYSSNKHFCLRMLKRKYTAEGFDRTVSSLDPTRLCT